MITVANRIANVARDRRTRCNVEYDIVPVCRVIRAELLAGDVIADPEGLADDERLELGVAQLGCPFALRSATVMPPEAALRASALGVYQIGELQARSCPVRGTTGGGGRPAFTAWISVQRGVGISSTRA